MIVPTAVPQEKLEEMAVQPVTSSIPRTNGIDLAEWIDKHGETIGVSFRMKGKSEFRHLYVMEPCPFDASHIGGCAHVHQKTDGQLGAGCKHSSCSWGWQELRAKAGDTFGARKARNTEADSAPKVLDADIIAGVKGAVLALPDLLTLEIPERRAWLPWFPEGGLVMEFGPRGIGKTLFAQSLACSLVTGEPFMRWTPAEPVGVLYIDGEMTLDALRTRFVGLFPPVKPKAPLRLLSSETVYQNIRRDLRLTDTLMRTAVDAILADASELRVVIIDNISCLFSGLDEDSKNSWEAVVPWLLSLRHRGVTALLVHHAGKGGDQRGTSGREDLLDTVVKLERPFDASAEDGARFTLRFTKSRGVTGEAVAPLEAKLIQDPAGGLTWACQSPAESLMLRFLRAIEDGVERQAELPDELGVNKGNVSRVKTQAKKAGLITIQKGNVLALTSEGRARING